MLTPPWPSNLGHDEAMEGDVVGLNPDRAGHYIYIYIILIVGLESCNSHVLYMDCGQVVKGVGHLGNDEAMEAGGREFDPRPGHYSRTSF